MEGRGRTAPVVGLLIALLAIAAGAWQRHRAVERLPPDYDEMVYIPIAFDYAGLIPERLEAIPSFAENREHPPMVKLTYAAVIDVVEPREPDWEQLRVGKPLPGEARGAFDCARWPSAVAGTLQLALLSLASPVAAALLAIEPYHAKYTSQAMLEAIPGVFALLAVLLLERALRPGTRRRLALTLGAAVALGASAAGKYPYGIVLGLTLLPFVVASFPRRPGVWASFIAIALAALVALDPTFWTGPFGRAEEALAFHWAYAHSEHVVKSALPWYAQVRWLFDAAPVKWHPGVFVTGLVAQALLPLALLGFPSAWRRRRLFAAWAAVGLLFLLLWPTKWPQYLLMALPAFAVCAAHAPRTIADLVARLRR